MTRVILGSLSALALLVASSQAGAITITIHEGSTTLAPKATGSAYADCGSSGGVVVGGGWRGSSSLVHTYRSYPLTTQDPIKGEIIDQWKVSAKNWLDVNATLTSYVVCARGLLSNAKSRSLVSGKIVLVDNTEFSFPQSCGGLGYLTGGGFKMQSSNPWMLLDESYSPEGTDYWVTKVRNKAGVQQYFYTYAVCTTGLLAHPFSVSSDHSFLTQGWVDPNNSGTVSCGDGPHLLSGGFTATGFYSGLDPYYGYEYRSMPTSSGDWKIHDHISGGYTGDYRRITPHARCVW